MMKWGILLLPASLTGVGELCRDVEAAGFDWLGVADSQSGFREMYVALTVATLNTSRVRLGPLVTNPLTRHPVVTAPRMGGAENALSPTDYRDGRGRLLCRPRRPVRRGHEPRRRRFRSDSTRCKSDDPTECSGHSQRFGPDFSGLPRRVI